MNCSSCGNPLDATAEFSARRCPRCGRELFAPYAPPTAPSAPPTPAPATPSRGLARAAVIGLGLNVATSLMAIAWSSYLLATQPDYLVTQESEDPENLGLILVDGLQSLFAFVVLLFTIVVFCLWLRRSNAALRTGGVSGLRFTPGWAVGWWFVPFANLYKPYEVMVELWRATTPGRDDWAFAPRSPALGWWWGFWIVSSLAGNAAARLTWNAESPEASHTALVASAVTDSLAVPAAALAAWLVWKIQERLEQKLGSPPALTRRSA